MIQLGFFFKELVTTYGATTHRGLTRWARVVHDENKFAWYDTYLCGALQSDFQNALTCKVALEEVARVETGEIEAWHHSGNQWLITATLQGVQIDHQTIEDWDEQPEGHFTLTQFKAALEGWKRFLQMPVSLESRLVVTLPDGETAT
jgi:hypothetical protein